MFGLSTGPCLCVKLRVFGNFPIPNSKKQRRRRRGHLKLLSIETNAFLTFKNDNICNVELTALPDTAEPLGSVLRCSTSKVASSCLYWSPFSGPASWPFGKVNRSKVCSCQSSLEAFNWNLPAVSVGRRNALPTKHLKNTRKKLPPKAKAFKRNWTCSFGCMRCVFICPVKIKSTASA